jgi:drug/metabolite transporter (DMT)-like permease
MQGSDSAMRRYRRKPGNILVLVFLVAGVAVGGVAGTWLVMGTVLAAVAAFCIVVAVLYLRAWRHARTEVPPGGAAR